MASFRRSRRTRLKHHHSGFWLFECTMLRIWLNRILITTHNNMLVLFIINVVVVLAVFIIQLQREKNLARFFLIHSTVVVNDDDGCWCCWMCNSPINPIRRDYCINNDDGYNNSVRWSGSGDDNDENWELFARLATITAITTFTLEIFFSLVVN